MNVLMHSKLLKQKNETGGVFLTGSIQITLITMMMIIMIVLIFYGAWRV